MPFTVHPSGFCTFWNSQAITNLKHDNGGKKEFSNCRSRRGTFHDKVASLAFYHKKINFWTFTVPELQGDYERTDKYFASRFSMLLENYRKQKLITSYVYIVEAQKRGNIHFHLVTNKIYIEARTVNDYWCKLINQYSKNAVDLSTLPGNIDRLPAYLSKYMSKNIDAKGGKGRIIHARSFNASRNLNLKAFTAQHHEIPYHLEHRKVVRVMEVDGRKIEQVQLYFKTSEIIRYFGPDFHQKWMQDYRKQFERNPQLT